jgi:hypothetical protein
MRRYATTFDYLHASLVANLAIYRNALEELLNPLMLSSSQMFRLLEDNDDQAWNDEELVVGLKIGSEVVICLPDHPSNSFTRR